MVIKTQGQELLSYAHVPLPPHHPGLGATEVGVGRGDL